MENIQGILVNSVNFVDNNDRSKKCKIDLNSASADTTTILKFEQTSNRTVTFPDADDKLIAENAPATISNKIFDDASTFIKSSTNPTSMLRFDVAGQPNSNIILSVDGSSGDSTITLPNIAANDSFVTKNNIVNIGSGIGIYDDTIPNYQVAFKRLRALSNKLSINDNTTDHTIDLDVTTGNTIDSVAVGNDGRFSDSKIIRVKKENPGFGEFSSIAAAVNSINDASESNPYLVQVGPGVFIEPLIHVQPWISVSGSTILPTVVKPDGNHHIFLMENNTELSFVNLQNAPTNCAAIASLDAGDFTQAFKVSIENCDIGILIESDTNDCYGYFEYIDINDEYSAALLVRSLSGNICEVNMENFYVIPSATTQTHVTVDGSGAALNILTSGILGFNDDGDAYRISNGAILKLLGTYVQDVDRGIHIINDGQVEVIGCHIDSYNTDIFVENGTGVPSLKITAMATSDRANYLLRVENPNTIGYYVGVSRSPKIYIHPNAPFDVFGREYNTLNVGKRASLYTSISQAINTINPQFTATINTGLTIITSSAAFNPTMTTFIISGPGIAPNTIFTYIDPSTGTLSNAATASGTFTFKITRASVNNPYLIYVSPGTYVEPELIIPSFVSITGSGPQITTIAAASPNQNIITMSHASLLTRLSITGATGTGYCGVILPGVLLAEVRDVRFTNCYTCIKQTASTIGIFTITTITNCVMVGPYTYAFHCDGTLLSGSNADTIMSIRSCGLFYANATASTHCFVDGPHATVNLLGSAFQGNSFNTGFVIQDGGKLKLVGCHNTGSDTGISVPNIGAPPDIQIVSVAIIDSINYDLNIQHPSTTGVVQAVLERSKTFVNENSTVTINYVDPINNGTTIGGALNLGPTNATAVNIQPLLYLGATIGPLEGGIVTTVSGLDISVSSGFGYVEDLSTGLDLIRYVTWNTTTLSMIPNAVNYIYISNLGVVTSAISPSAFLQSIPLARVITNATDIEFIDNAPMVAKHPDNYEDIYRKIALGPLYANGSIVTSNASREIAVSSGRYFFSANDFNPSGKDFSDPYLAYYNSGSGHTSILQTIVDNTQYDNGTGLAPIPTGQYIKHTLYTVGEGPNEKYLLVYGQTLFASSDDAIGGVLPSPPPSFVEGVVLIAGIVVQEGNSSIVSITSERPVVGSRTGTIASTINHGDLLGLENDDHPQYFLTNGDRIATGDFNMGTNNIINVNQVNGVTVQAHASRHLPNNEDPLATAAPDVPLSATTTNLIGTANSFARSNHTHALVTSTPVQIQPDQPNTLGTSSGLARADHVHNIPTDPPITPLSATTASSSGNVFTFARSNHTHEILTGIVSTQLADQTNQIGTSANIARADHIHNIPTSAPVAIGSSNLQGSASTFAKSDHIHEGVHSFKIGTAGTQLYGDIIITAGNGIDVVDNGDGSFTVAAIAGANELRITDGGGLTANYTSGNIIINGQLFDIPSGSITLPPNVTNGTIYVDLNGTVVSSTANTFGGSIIPLALFTTNSTSIVSITDARTVVNRNIIFGTDSDISQLTPDAGNSAGVLFRQARADHIHNVPTDVPISIGTTNTEGIGSAFARNDHQHQGIHSLNANAGDQIYGDVSLLNGYGISITNNTNSFTIATIGNSNTEIMVTTLAGLTATYNSGRVNINGNIINITSGNIILPASTTGYIFVDVDGVVRSGTNLLSGTVPLASFVTNTTSITSLVDIRTFLNRSNIFGDPVTITPEQGNIQGTSYSSARADHIHNIPTDTPVSINNINDEGIADAFARSDHKHQGVHSISTNGGTQNYGDINLQNGYGISINNNNGTITIGGSGNANTEFFVTANSDLTANYNAGRVNINGTIINVSAGTITLPAFSVGFIYVGTDGVVASGSSLPPDSVPMANYITSASTITSITDIRTFIANNITFGLPTTLTADQGNIEGVSNRFSRSDHIHNVPTAAPLTMLSATTTNAQGSATTFSRSDHIHAIVTGTPVTQIPAQNNSNGTSAALARADHIHNIPTAAPITSLTTNTSNSEGITATFARSDHTHAILSDVPITQTPDSVNIIGTSTAFARADHIHNIPTAAPTTTLTANITNSQGTATTFARSDHTHAISTAAAITQTPDQTNSSGTSASLARADHVHNIPTATAIDIGSSNTQGVATTFSKSDHQHRGVHSIRSNTDAQAFGDIILQNGYGVSLNSTGGTITISASGNSNTELLVTQGSGLNISYNSGRIIFNGIITNISGGTLSLPPSTTGFIYADTDATVKVNTTLPSGIIPMASFTTGTTTITTLTDIRSFINNSRVFGTPITQTPDQTNSSGTSNTYARADHVHNIPTAAPTTTLDAATTNTQGSANTFAKSDHTHAISTAAPITTLTATTTNSAGTAASLARSDHTHAISTGIAITQTPDQANTIGTSSNLARADHVHNIPTATAIDIGSTNTQGTAATFARSDHQHRGVHSIRTNTDAQAFGDITLQNGYGITLSSNNGTITVATTGNTNTELLVTQGSGLSISYNGGRVIYNSTITNISGGTLILTSSSTGFIYVDIDATVKSNTILPANSIPMASFTTGTTSITSLVDIRTFMNNNLVFGTPVTQTPDQTNSSGTSNTYARADHIHNIPTAAPTIILDATTTNTQGSASTFAKSDHTHAISTGVVTTQLPDQTNAAGTSANLARADHVHNIPTAAPTTTLSATTTNAQGTALTFARSDHTHAISTAAPTTTLSATTTNSAGTAASLARSDHTHAISTGIAITQTPDQANAIGTSANLARSDHVHNIPTAAPTTTLTSTTTNAQGTAATFARSDHTHAIDISTFDLNSVGGTLAVSKGGTGVATLTTNGVLIGNGTSAVTTTKAAPSGAFAGTTDAQTFTNKTITGTTNNVDANSLRNGSTWAVSMTGSAPSAGQVLTATAATTAAWATPTQVQVATIYDSKASGTAGGTFTSGSWQVRTLNTITNNAGANIALASNQFTLQPGTYKIDAVAPANRAGNHQIRIFDVTNNTAIAYGISSFTSTSTTNIQTVSTLYHNLVVSVATTYQLEHRCSVTRATDGFGLATSFGGNEIYAQVSIMKLV